MNKEDKIIYQFEDKKSLPEKFCEYRGVIPEGTPLVIDNGSYHFRAGWACNDTPSIIFKNVVARNRGNRKDRDWTILVGNDIPDLEAVRWMVRTAFDFNVVVNFGIQENVFDHAFFHLGIDTDGKVCHPVVMTEPVANPAYSRKQMSELLFEAYDIPQLAYGIDSMFSYEYNKGNLQLEDDVLLITSGFQSTHVLPIINGVLDLKNCKRINLGGYNNGAYLQRLLQLRHPKLSSSFTLTRMDQFLRDMAEVPSNYMDEVRKWLEPEFVTSNTIMMQIPEKPSSSSQSVNPPNEETITLSRALRRMECKLYDLECVLELEEENLDGFTKALSDSGYQDSDELNSKISELQKQIDKTHEEITHLLQNSLVPAEVPIRIEKHQTLEILFQPMLVGYDQAGLGEVMEMIFKQYSPDQCNRMAKNVVITGGNTQYKGFKERITAELIKCRPYQSECRVQEVSNPSLDAWNGARQWAADNAPSAEVWMTRTEFQDKGWDYLKEHSMSNRYYGNMDQE